MPKGQAYVMEQLRNCGLDPHPCGHDVTAKLGRGQDASAPGGYGRAAHAGGERRELYLLNRYGGKRLRPRFPYGHAADCGKDAERKGDALSGRVRLMFQPTEKTFEGAKDMMAAEILEGVDAALAYHVGSGRMPVGLFMYNSGGTMMYSVDGFRITSWPGRPRRLSARFHRPNQYRRPHLPRSGVADCPGGSPQQSLRADHRQFLSGLGAQHHPRCCSFTGNAAHQ